MLGSCPFLPIHWGTFNRSMHAWDEPPETITRLAPGAGVPLLMRRLGEPAELSREPMVDMWWREVSAKGAREVRAAVRPDDGTPLEWLPD